MQRLLLGTFAMAALLFADGGVQAQEYEPSPGDSVVIYTNKFKPDEFQRAREIMVEGFSGAMEASQQTRRTFWMADEKTGEIIGVSFFMKGHSVDEWHDHEARQEVLEQLAPLRSAPLVMQHFTVIGHHKAGQ